MKKSTEEEIKFKGIVKGPCPFCKGKWQAGTAMEKNVEEPCVIHSLPECQKFRDCNPDEFLYQVRKEFESYVN